MTRSVVLVGVDASAPSWAAVQWAAREAGRRGVPLRVVTAYRRSWAAGDASDATAFDRARTVVTDMTSRARAEWPGLLVTGAAVYGTPTRVLRDAGAAAALVVVGHRDRARPLATLVGSTSGWTAAHAPAPVAVVRGRDHPTGPVLVGFDGTGDILGAAFAEADDRGADLMVVHAYREPAHLIETGIVIVEDQGPGRDEAAERLAETLRPWREKYPYVEVRTLVTAAEPGAALIELSGTARLIVVGTRGHGELAGALIGSVGRRLIHHADCPVFIVRDTTGT